MSKIATVVVVTGMLGASVLGAQAPLTFDVVSIRQNTSGQRPNSGPEDRPDGGFRMTNQPIRLLIGLAYPAIQAVGLPDWVTRTPMTSSPLRRSPTPLATIEPRCFALWWPTG